VTSEELKAVIARAFDGVRLGDGVGLREAQAMDDYEDETTQKRHRSKDEKLDWSRISAETLNRCESSLSFFDADGMRFHLPAFLLIDIDGKSNSGPIFDLTTLNDHKKAQFASLDGDQRKAVAAFLHWYLLHDLCVIESRPIERALRDFWEAT